MYLTIIWVCLGLFVSQLLGLLWVHRHHTWQGGQGGPQNPAWDIRFHGNQKVVVASYYNLSLHWVCLSLNSLAVYGSTGIILGREVHGIRFETFVSMATKQLSWHSRKTLLRLKYWADDVFFYISSLLGDSNLPIKSQQNLPSSFRDRPMATYGLKP